MTWGRMASLSNGIKALFSVILLLIGFLEIMRKNKVRSDKKPKGINPQYYP
jgi:hypothetical protein